MSEKICRQCGIPKDLDLFYKHSQMADGHLNKCIACVKSRIKKYEKDNPEKIRIACREKMRRPKYVAKHKAWLEANPERAQAIQDRWYEKNQDKRYAHRVLDYALRKGTVIKADHCQHESGCTVTDRLEGHHPDYSKPLEVVWLCRTHHGETRHKA